MANARFRRRKSPARPAPHLALLALEDRTLPSTAGVLDFGFETSAVAAGAYKYGPAGSAWAFAGTAGLSANGSGFTSGNPAAPQGTQVAFLQGTGAITQTMTTRSDERRVGK